MHTLSTRFLFVQPHVFLDSLRRHQLWSTPIYLYTDISCYIAAQLSIKVSILPSMRNSPALSVHQACAYLTKMVQRVIDHFWVGSRALQRKERVVCVSVHAGTHLSSPLVKQNPWNAAECLFRTWSSVLLQTGEFCTLHSQHNTWFTLSHQRKRWRMHTVTHTHIHTHVPIFPPPLSNMLLTD